ncbi:MAG: hypothetical protein ACM31L_03890 [Actinomycetota bacterium]
MRRTIAVIAVGLALALPARAEDQAAPPAEPPATGAPLPLVPAAPTLSQPLPPAVPLVPSPPLVPATPEPAPPVAAPQPAPAPVPPAPAPVAEQPPAPPPPAVQPPAPAPAPAEVTPVQQPQIPLWLIAVLVASGGAMAGLIGALLAAWQRRLDVAERRRAAAAVIALELETRRQAFEAVPVPPNAEAGVSFVSAVTALAGLDGGWRAMQGSAHLLPEKIAVHLAAHYAAVHHVADFVKGQSMAAAVRMLQANRIGGHPTPDAGMMRECHVELASAFRGVDKMVQSLRALR